MLDQKILLSRLMSSDANEALTLILEKINFIREQNKNSEQRPSHKHFIGNDDEMVWNIFLSFLEGEQVTWTRTEKENVDFSITTEMMEQLNASIEMDLMPEILSTKLDTLENNHPYWMFGSPRRALSLIRDILDYYIVTNAIPSTVEHAPADYTIRRNGLSLEVVPAIPHQDSKSDINANLMSEIMTNSTKFRDHFESVLKRFTEGQNEENQALYERHRQKHIQKKRATSPKTSVIGLGPSGIFASIYAYDEGASVTAIEKRSTYTRNNVFRLTPEAYNDFISLFVDSEQEIALLTPTHPLRVAVETHIISPRAKSPLGDFYAISIKDFENLANVCLEVIANSEKNAPNKDMLILRGFEYLPNSIDRENKFISVQKDKELMHIETDVLVGSDGYNSKIRSECGILTNEMSDSVPYATFTYFPPRSGVFPHQSALAPTPRREVNLDHLKSLGWEYDRQPVVRFFNTGEHCYLGVEIPRMIADEYNDLSRNLRNEHNPHNAYILKQVRTSGMEAWGQYMLQMFLPDAAINSLILKDEAIIDVKLRAATEVYRKQGNMTVLLIGDAAQSAHFQTGRGAIAGISESQEVGKFVHEITFGTPIETAGQNFTNQCMQTQRELHQLAFNFPTKENLRINPTESHIQFNQATQLENMPYYLLPLELRKFISRETQLERHESSISSENYWNTSSITIKNILISQYRNFQNDTQNATEIVNPDLFAPGYTLLRKRGLAEQQQTNEQETNKAVEENQPPKRKNEDNRNSCLVM